MTDKSKDERRPARRTGGDAARPSKGTKNFKAPRSFAGGKGAPSRSGERNEAGGDRPRTGHGKPRFSDKGGFGERKSFAPRGDRPEGGDRPARRFEGSDRPRSDRPFSDKPRFGDKGGFGDRKPYAPRGERPEGGDRPARRFEGSDRPRSDRPFSDKPRFGDKGGFGERKPYAPRGERPEGGDRPARRFEGSDRPRSDRPFSDKPRFGDKGGFGERKPYASRGERPEGGDRPARRFEGSDRPRSDRSFSDKPRFGDKGGFGERKPYASRGERPEGGDRPPRRFVGSDRPQRFENRAEQQAAPVSATPEPERIAKVMARAGVASRRDAEVMISEGRVAVNGKAINTPATLVTDSDRIVIDGAPMPARERTRLWLYHKPRGLVTTARDPEGRPTVFDNLPEDLPRVVAIGRLDINTEGLLLLTNDGGVARVLAHPETAWLRRYRVRAYGEVNQAQLDNLRNGVTIDGMHYGPIEASIQRTQGDNVWLMLGLREGKNREVKRILEHLGLRVNRLIRVSFGPFQLGDLEEGTCDEVRTRILKDQLGEALALEAGVDFEAGIAQLEPRPTAPAVAGRGHTGGRENRFRSKEDFLARGQRAPAAPVEEYKREAYEQRSKERAVWRDVDTEEGRPKGKRIPRRGADARAARSQSAERTHERVGAVKDPGGRMVKVERIVSAPKLAERAPRGARRVAVEGSSREAYQNRGESFQKRDSDRFGGERPARRFDDRGGEKQERRSFSDRAEQRGEGFRRDDRPAGGNRFGDRDRGNDRGGDRDGFKPRGERSFGDKRHGDRSAGKSFGAKSFGDKPAGDRPYGKKSFGDKPSGGKSFGNKSFGDRSFGDKPAGGRSFGGKPSGGKAFGGKPSGGRSFGDRPSGGSRPPRKF
ncbi:pseudouridine synthase [Pseudochelatococcus sp. G4_1912]